MPERGDRRLHEAVRAANVQREPRHRVSMLLNDWQEIEAAANLTADEPSVPLEPRVTEVMVGCPHPTCYCNAKLRIEESWSPNRASIAVTLGDHVDPLRVISDQPAADARDSKPGEGQTI